MRKKWSKPELLEILKSKADKLGRAPTSLEVNDDPTMPSASTFAKFFGSWADAVRAIGLEPHQRHVNSLAYSKEELLELLQCKARELGRAPTSSEMIEDPLMPSPMPFSRCFGSWNKALVAAGISPYDASGKRFSDEYLIETLKAKAKELGHSPSKYDMSADPSLPMVETYIKRFDGWNNALKAAGLEINLLGHRRQSHKRS